MKLARLYRIAGAFRSEWWIDPAEVVEVESVPSESAFTLGVRAATFVRLRGMRLATVVDGPLSDVLAQLRRDT